MKRIRDAARRRGAHGASGVDRDSISRSIGSVYAHAEFVGARAARD